MGVLFNSMEIRKQVNVMDRLKEKGITKARDGRMLSELSYKELKLELVFADFTDINVDSDSNSWF